MADHDRYSRQYDYERNRQRRQNQDFDNRRLDDRDSYGPTGQGYRGQGADYGSGYQSYGRDGDRPDREDRYGREERSFQQEAAREGGYYGTFSGGQDAYGGGAVRQSDYRGGQRNNYQPQRYSGGYRGYGATYMDDNPGSAFTAPRYEELSDADSSYHRDRDTYRHGGSDGRRGFWEKAADEVSSWFGDEAANQRREFDGSYHTSHRGKGPKGYKRSDDRIRDDINDRLSDDHWLDASDIEVKVDSCEVTLSGNVPDREAKRRAENLAETISGVTHVQNNLRVMNRGVTQLQTQGSEALGAASGMGASGSVLADQASGRTRGTA
jgi:osmotically-inducible protein OsmY